MSTSAVEASIVDVGTTSDQLVVKLDDGREVRTPLRWYPRLEAASAEERGHYELVGGGEAVSWPAIDEDLSLAGMLAGVSATGYRPEAPTPAGHLADERVAAAREFFGASLASVEQQLASVRSQLEGYAGSLPAGQEGALSLVNRLADSLEPVVEVVEDAAYAHEVEDHLAPSPRRGTQSDRDPERNPEPAARENVPAQEPGVVATDVVTDRERTHA